MSSNKNIYHLDLGGRFHLCGKVKGKYLYNLSALDIENVNCPDCISLSKSIRKKSSTDIIQLKRSELFCVGDKLYAYRMLFNCSTGKYEIVTRGAGVVCEIPCPVGFSHVEHEELLKSIMRGFTDDLCNYDHDSSICRLFGSDYYDLMNSGDYDDSYYEPSETEIVKYDGKMLIKNNNIGSDQSPAGFKMLTKTCPGLNCST